MTDPTERMAALGFVPEDVAPNKGCEGCVLNHQQDVGPKCKDVPCSWFVMGRDVIWVKSK